MNSNKHTPPSIRSINGLVTALVDGERATFNQIFRSFHIPLIEFEDLCSWSDDGYTRNCIYEDERFELILLCWERDQKTPIHDHGGEECWVKTLHGELEEAIYHIEDDELKLIKTDISQTNDVTYMIDFMGVHSLENISDGRSMSLHLYAKPIKTCNILDENSGEFVCQEMTYSTVPTSIEN